MTSDALGHTFAAVVPPRVNHEFSLQMTTSGAPVDFDLVRENAAKQGVDLSQIAIFYSELTDAERTHMKALDIITHDAGPASPGVVARFMANGDVAFPDKATGVHYLAAD